MLKWVVLLLQTADSLSVSVIVSEFVVPRIQVLLSDHLFGSGPHRASIEPVSQKLSRRRDGDGVSGYGWFHSSRSGRSSTIS